MRGAPIIVALFLLANADLASAKEHAVRSPSGRRIYNPDETFAEVLDQDSRRFIVEAAVGAGPEGHLAMGLGYLFKDLPGLAVYASVPSQSSGDLRPRLSLAESGGSDR